MKDVEDTRVASKTFHEYIVQAKKTIAVFRWVLNELKTPETVRWTKRLVMVVVLMTVIQAIQPRLIGYVIDGLDKHDRGYVILGLLSFFVCMQVQRYMDYHQASAKEWMLGLTWGALDRRIAELFFGKSMGQHINESSQLSVANIDKGRWRLLEIQNLVFTDGIPAFLTMGFSYVLLWVLSPVAGLVMTMVIAIYVVWMLYLNQKVIEVCTPIDANLRKFNRYFIERMENVERVKTNAKEPEELGVMRKWFDQAIADDRAFWLWFVRQSTYRKMTGVVGLLVIYAYGAWLVMNGKMALGLIFPLFSWSAQVVDNIWRIGQIEHVINWNMPTIRAMIEALSINPDVVSRTNGIDISAAPELSISFEHITHTYPIGSEESENNAVQPLPVLTDVSFTIPAGKKVALIGPSGSGKTTLMRLLLRFMDPDSGTIRMNGIDLRDVRLDSWMNIAGYIPQQAQILDGTLKYNLSYGLPILEREAMNGTVLQRFMSLLKIDFGNRLTHGLETQVGRHGIKLSGGQSQRVMIGAAAIKRPRFMVIDEATSHLDSTTERAVHDGLSEILKDDVGALIVAHRLSTVRDLCDQFIVLRSSDDLKSGESQIEAIGDSFEDLYKISPTFRRLANDQHIVMNRVTHVA